MREAALDCYREAIRSGWLDLGMRALVRALAMADGDEARLELADLFAASPADLMEDNIVGRKYGWWEELIVAAEPAFEAFPAKLGMVERLLDAALGFEEDHIDINRLLYQRTREVYYRLYDETGDRRWLDCALPSQLKLRPRLKKFEGYIRGEIAFMQGEYRRHFDLAERRYLEHDDYPSVPRGSNFLGRKMAALEIRVDGESRNYADALERYQMDLFDALYDKGVHRTAPRRTNCASTRRANCRRRSAILPTRTSMKSPLGKRATVQPDYCIDRRAQFAGMTPGGNPF